MIRNQEQNAVAREGQQTCAGTKKHAVGIRGRRETPATRRRLTEHAVDRTNEDVVLFGDFGEEDIRGVRSVSHLKQFIKKKGGKKRLIAEGIKVNHGVDVSRAFGAG